jgi:hypothetical protein
MVDATAVHVITENRPAVALGRKWRWFFPVCSGLLLAGLVVGFAPSFFLRGYINTPFPLRSIPPYLIAHGTVLTIWFALVVAQSVLVAAHRIALHRRLGTAGIVVAVLVVPISVLVVVRSVPRFLVDGVPREALYGIILGDFLALGLFCVFVVLAVYMRRKRTDIHKRLMLASCFVIYGPVLSRLGTFYGLHASTPVVLLVLFAALAIYDVVMLKRVHRATLLSASAVFGVFAVGMIILVPTGIADIVIDRLR